MSIRRILVVPSFVSDHLFLLPSFRFYLLSPNTSYAGEYTWNGDPQSGCAQILKDTGIAKDEWQMGTTKAFIKNPETVRSSSSSVYSDDSADLGLSSFTALRARDDARSILAQHGWSNPTSLEELPSVPKRVRLSDPTLLEEQEGRNRVRQVQAEGTRPSRWTEGEEEIQSRQHEAIRWRLPRRRRTKLERSRSQERCWIGT